MFEGFPAHWSTLKKLIWLKASALASAVYQTVTGAIATFTTLRAAPLKALSVAIEPVQSGSGDPSPDNVRPISGWSEVNVWREATHDTSADPTVTIDLDGTRYGGTLDVLTGVLTVNRAFLSLDGTENWTGPSGNGYFLLNIGDRGLVVNDDAICSHFKGNPSITSANSQIGFRVYNRSTNPNAAVLLVRMDSTKQQTLAQFESFLAGQAEAETPVCVVYKLDASQSQTIQLTANEVATLLGDNNIWADTGDVTVTYQSN